jgi:hypothetical protein
MIRVVQRSRFSTKPPPATSGQAAKTATKEASAPPTSGGGGGVSGIALVGLGVVGVCAAIAINPDSVRKTLNTVGVGGAFEPFIANVEKATSSFRSTPALPPPPPPPAPEPVKKKEEPPPKVEEKKEEVVVEEPKKKSVIPKSDPNSKVSCRTVALVFVYSCVDLCAKNLYSIPQINPRTNPFYK